MCVLAAICVDKILVNNPQRKLMKGKAYLVGCRGRSSCRELSWRDQNSRSQNVGPQRVDLPAECKLVAKRRAYPSLVRIRLVRCQDAKTPILEIFSASGINNPYQLQSQTNSNNTSWYHDVYSVLSGNYLNSPCVIESVLLLGFWRNFIFLYYFSIYSTFYSMCILLFAFSVQ